MTRTRTNITGGRRETLPEAVVESPARGRGRSRARGRASSTIVAKGRGHGAAPERGRAREDSTKPHIDGREDQIPPEPIVTPLLHDTLLRVLSVLEGFSKGGGRPPHHMLSYSRGGSDPRVATSSWYSRCGGETTSRSRDSK